MRKVSKILWGLLLVAVGLVFGLNALGITNIDIFFDGWWTLFIIVPCGIGLFRDREKTGNLIGILIGVALLLWCQDILDLSLIGKLLIPAVIVLIGVKIIFNAFAGDEGRKVFARMIADGKVPKAGCAAFGGCEMNFDNQVFEGADLTSVFGGVDCNLRNAVVEGDCAIKVCAVFGGIDILVPENVRVQVSTTSIFGGVSNEARGRKDAPYTLYISGLCLFGGVDIK